MNASSVPPSSQNAAARGRARRPVVLVIGSSLTIKAKSFALIEANIDFSLKQTSLR
jgi:hypothetical protein